MMGIRALGELNREEDTNVVVKRHVCIGDITGRGKMREEERETIELYNEHVNVEETGESSRSERGRSEAKRTGDWQRFIA